MYCMYFKLILFSGIDYEASCNNSRTDFVVIYITSPILPDSKSPFQRQKEFWAAGGKIE